MSKNRSQRAFGNLRQRKNFARIPTVIDIPNLIGIQKKSFEHFLQWDVAPHERQVRGLEDVFNDIFPISDLNASACIEYTGYEVGIWECGCGEFKELGGPGIFCDKCKEEVAYQEKRKFSECRQKGLTYSDPIKIMVRLLLFDREAVDVNPRTLKNLIGQLIVEEVKKPGTSKNLIPAKTEITEKENNAIIVASYGTFSTGINIKNLHNVIFASPSKSRIRNLQSIGRVLRKGANKVKAILYDIADDCTKNSRRNYTLNHFIERIKIYNEENFNYEIITIQLKKE